MTHVIVYVPDLWSETPSCAVCGRKIVAGEHIRIGDGRVVHEALIHKAEPHPEFTDDATSTCIHCHDEIRKVPGGQGPTWVHGDGRVVGSGPPKKTQ